MKNPWQVVLVLAFVLVVALWPVLGQRPVLLDDGYYYLTIARNMAAGEGSTFDGLHATNGYHPLWMLVLVPLVALAGSAQRAILLAGVVQAALNAGAAALLFAVVRRLAGAPAAALAVLLWIELVHRVWLRGMEYALHAFLLGWVTWLFLCGSGRRSMRGRLALGGLLAFLFLARLDTALLVPLIAAGMWIETSGAPLIDRVRYVATFLGPPIAAVGVYLLSNMAWHGTPLPISGAVKRAWSSTLAATDPVYQQYGWLLAKVRLAVQPLLHSWGDWALRSLAWGLAAFGLWSLLIMIDARDPSRSWFGRTARRLTPLMLYSGTSYLVYIALYERPLVFSPRYFVVQPWLASLFAGIALSAVAKWLRTPRWRCQAPRWRNVRRFALLVGILVIGIDIVRDLTVLRHGEERSGEPQMVGAARWARVHLPAGARIGAWNAGALGFLSGHRVVNLDGVVNDRHFFLEERHDLCRYWQRVGITHIVDVFVGDEPSTPVSVWSSYAHCAGDLEPIWTGPALRGTYAARVFRLRTKGQRAARASTETIGSNDPAWPGPGTRSFNQV